MAKKEAIEMFLILIIAVLFCFPLFLVYNVQKDKVDNIEKEVLGIKEEIYTLKLDIINLSHNENVPENK